VKDSSSQKTIEIFTEALNLFGETFGHLSTNKDWSNLLDHLLCYCDLKDALAGNIPKDDIINFVILLFQSVCPIRFAFLDGQARAVSTAFYLRKMFPTGPVSRELFRPLGMVEAELKNKEVVDHLDWSISKTGLTARCNINFPADVGPSKVVTIDKQLDQMFDHSKTLLDSLTNMTPRNLGDAILYVIRKHDLETGNDPIQTTVRLCYEHVVDRLCDYDEALASKLFPNLPNRQELAKNNELFHNVIRDKSTTPFPTPKGNLRGTDAEVVALMYTVGCLLVGMRQHHVLERCMNTEWKVPILHKDQIPGDYEISDLHKHTFVGGPEMKTLFEEKYYQVCY
jgi:hypothetical protein